MKLIVLTLAALLSTAAVAAEPLKKTDGVYVDAAGMTVYTFDKDVAGSGKSACVDGCLKNWPAVAAAGELAAPWSAITRDDGSKQLAYKGKPLYLFVGDKKAGDRAGDNVKDIWHVVKD
ncbi:Predicted lipoprotein with conserved Yx(FWY)xxD motif [Duganella sp. CF458]|uniref:COG4315 family predicted lipoprotein n=1 Tax=Duganella sp. CF458 TaxID=1884368 RepID=UPI0008EE9684|nr:hypothetical protein [Duganella sp. CF458]SFG18953.1 Predicted lipoprotein with conserved Yx(FWY)xxD motif [Duganella sp. CF458]